MKSYRLFAGVAAISLGFMLSGCGDGGGPASTPPPPSYQTLKQIVAAGSDHSFATSGIQVTFDSSGNPGNLVSRPLGSGVTIAYTASNNSYTVTAPEGNSAVFTPAELVANPPGYAGSATYSSPTSYNRLMLVPASVNGVALSYTMMGGWIYQNAAGNTVSEQAIGGVPTIASDMPRSGTASYAVAVSADILTPTDVYQASPGTSKSSFSVNFSAGTVATTINLTGTSYSQVGTANAPTTDFGTFSGTGAIKSGTAGFSGTFAGTTTSLFTGNFNGPQAAEMGYNFAFATPGMSAIGQVVGKKN